MNRATFNKLLEVFTGELALFSTQFSGEASLVSPATGNHIEVFSIKVDGPDGLTGTSGIQFQDGTDAEQTRFYVTAGDSHMINFGTRFWRVDTSLRATRPASLEHELSVTIAYKERPNIT